MCSSSLEALRTTLLHDTMMVEPCGWESYGATCGPFHRRGEECEWDSGDIE